MPQKPVEVAPKPPIKPEVKSAAKPKIVPSQAKVITPGKVSVTKQAAVKPKTPIATKPVQKPVSSSTVPKAAPKMKPQSSKAQIYEIIYPVQPGDTLWQIAKRYNVDVEKLKKHNNLSTTALKPGSTLRIPKEQKPSSGK